MNTESEEIAKTGVMYFSISGEAITNIARDFWVEGRRTQALKLLRDIRGVDELMAFKIVTGEKKFIGEGRHGNNTLELVDDDGDRTRHGIDLSLTHQIEMIEKKATEESNIYHLMRFPWFHFNRETGQARVVQREIMPGIAGMHGCHGENDPLPDYKAFLRWVRDVTHNYDFPAEWTLESTRNIEHWRGHPWQLPKEWTRYDTDAMLEIVDTFIDAERERLLNIEQYLGVMDERCKNCEDKGAFQALLRLQKQCEAKFPDVGRTIPGHPDYKGSTGKYADLDPTMKGLLLRSISDIQAVAMNSGLRLTNERAAEAAEIQLGLREPPKVTLTQDPVSPSGILTTDGYYPCPYMGHNDLLDQLGLHGAHNPVCSDIYDKKGWIEISEMRFRIRKEPNLFQRDFLGKLINKFGPAEILGEEIADEIRLNEYLDGAWKDSISDAIVETRFVPRPKEMRDGD